MRQPTQPPPAPPIQGTTRLYAVLGDPVAQVQAPSLVNPLLAALHRDAVVVPVHARPEHLETVVRGLQRVQNLDGMFVTVPHKAAVRHLADRCGTTVDIVGTANVLRREADGGWLAENFDGSGFVTGLVGAGHDPRGGTAALVGTGGAGSAIAAALLTAGTERLHLYDTDPARLAALTARLDAHWPGRVRALDGPLPRDLGLAVNATPLGLRAHDPLPFPLEPLAPDCVVADIVMKPRETRLLREAAARGHRIHHGIHMLEGQLNSYREFFDFR
ncbi:shikimate dehydrogenase [Streptomyces parvulus]|uniref:Shikimate dehydrogenase n=1 Tax=Streptomyces parvulus TaxID=146923 RepID=A0A191VA04_9ACTN|nr:shikimate dehydrogenase [Streptomyces parvulus]ANJ11859.1 shikimate dehydrogenase [Streptomyces parvulus]MCC9157452.1 shikimate dehydrogenase [Streptomyces parvulus]MCE7691557.1 shikimate dehydrogenase [Streptomyces parvulus]MCQ4193400.1 shikimate dehydrogenase [Streptomyces parvulus]GGR98683.1 shikimate dehydrogenase [Streptomyces parvulus]